MYRLVCSVVYPNPDPYVFEPPRSGSGSFQQQAIKVRKTIIFLYFLLLFDFLSLKTGLIVPK
jgi:hypothetical protein